jgi:hypothetical protein
MQTLNRLSRQLCTKPCRYYIMTIAIIFTKPILRQTINAHARVDGPLQLRLYGDLIGAEYPKKFVRFADAEAVDVAETDVLIFTGRAETRLCGVGACDEVDVLFGLESEGFGGLGAFCQSRDNVSVSMHQCYMRT